jgi:hypothetical protein
MWAVLPVLISSNHPQAPSFEEDFAVLGVKRELNCVPILLRLMQKGVYSPYTRGKRVFILPILSGAQKTWR